MIFKTILLSSFLLATALADPLKPAIATLDLESNFDMGLIRKEFRVHYSGLGIDSSKPVSIKIHQEENTTPHEFIVKDKVTEPKAYYLAFDSVNPGKYEVEVCQENICSDRTPALTELKDKSSQKPITCHQGYTYTAEGQRTEISPETAINFKIGQLDDDRDTWYNAADIKTYGETLKRDLTIDFNTISAWNRLSVQNNPSYNPATNVFYAGVKYSLHPYEQLFAETSNEYCQRKYLLSGHVHLVDTESKEVKYRFKTTVHPRAVLSKYFVKGTSTKMFLEMPHEDVTIVEGSYTVMAAICLTDKDSTKEPTVCSEPIRHHEPLVVPAPQQ